MKYFASFAVVILLDISFDTAAENLAFEEWYFHHFKEETLRIWRNPSAVVVGKHQNAFAECNPHYCFEEGIPVLRRISGGGTVYHDPGNINFSFFRFVERDRQIDYDANLDLIASALQQLGYAPRKSERHDLFIGDRKISGNAQHVSKGRALHHGTLLYDSELSRLRLALKREHGQYIDRSVQSVRSSVTNLREIRNLGAPSEFITALKHALHLPLAKPDFNPAALGALLETRYLQDEWNIGYGPGYRFESSWEGLPFALTVQRGGIIEAAEAGDHALKEHLKSLIGTLHLRESMRERLNDTATAAVVDRLLQVLY